MGGRFGKYGDMKRRQRLRKTRLRPPDLKERAKEKILEEIHKRKKGRRGQKEGS
jgi:hypothetical protein